LAASTTSAEPVTDGGTAFSSLAAQDGADADSSLFSTVSNAASGAWNAASEEVSGALNAVEDDASEVWNAVSDEASSAWGTLTNAASDLASEASSEVTPAAATDSLHYETQSDTFQLAQLKRDIAKHDACRYITSTLAPRDLVALGFTLEKLGPPQEWQHPNGPHITLISNHHDDQPSVEPAPEPPASKDPAVANAQAAASDLEGQRTSLESEFGRVAKTHGARGEEQRNQLSERWSSYYMQVQAELNEAKSHVKCLR
jgi:hypothetical protein